MIILVCGKTKISTFLSVPFGVSFSGYASKGNPEGERMPSTML